MGVVSIPAACLLPARGEVLGYYLDAGFSQPITDFTYNERGFRIRKHSYQGGLITYYVNDASGHLLSVYDNQGASGVTEQTEVPVYGSNRIGIYYRKGGNFNYELSDHLGSVRVVISGTKRVDGSVNVVQYNDYYPYGSPLQRGGNGTYRYDYQGQYAEKDPETGLNNFQLRMYDPVIGRWMRTDPAGQFASPYEGMGNNPVSGTDPTGGEDDDHYYDSKTKQTTIVATGDDFNRYYTDGQYEGYSFKGGAGDYLPSYGQEYIVSSGIIAGLSPMIQGGAGASQGGVININRTWETDNSTINTFTTGSGLKGYTLEPEGPSTTQSGQDQRIPAGAYNLMKSPGTAKDIRLHAEWELYNNQVPDSRHILFHLGNYPGDTEGCFLIGNTRGVDFVGGNSKSATDALNNCFNSFNGNVKVIFKTLQDPNIMKLAKFILILILNVGLYANAQSKAVSNNHSNDSLSLKAKKLKQLYLLSTASSKDVSDVYKQQFFDFFPNTFKQLNELYGDHKSAPLNDQAEQHIVDLFNNLNNINDTLYYRKIVSIAVGGHWDADAINFFQHGLRAKTVINPALIVHVLKSLSNEKIQSFWYFYFDGAHPKKQIAEPLQRIKAIDSKIYSLMIEAQDDVLRHSKE